jgi:antirestriction protein ArdC
MRRDVYETITDQIVADLEQGVRPWLKPWNADHMDGRITRPLRHNGIPYQGVNVLTLWMAACAKDYAAPIWMTFKQAIDLGGAVRKGEKSSLVVYANSITRSETDPDTGEEQARDIHYMKGYSVFNTAQIDGLPAQYYAKPEPLAPRFHRIAHAEAFFAATRADIRHGGNRAYYAPSLDTIQMPPFESFRDPESYYATLAHEGTHWSGHGSRLSRSFGSKRWGDDGYAVEELVAELGAAFLCADLGLAAAPRDDHASYIDHWLRVLKQDSRAIFAAASHAQRAADFLHALQSSAEVAEEAA